MNWTIVSTDSSGFWFVLQRQSDAFKITVHVPNADLLSPADLTAALTSTASSYGAKESAKVVGPSPMIGKTVTTP